MIPDESKKILVTAALPYANGPIHIGHLVEYIQADIWVRYLRLRGRQVIYLCADDTHGTPIMIRARDEGISPTELIERVGREHLRDFTGFSIRFDEYHSTDSPENEALSIELFEALERNGHVERRTIEQAYCPRDEMFLPDRYVKGTCPTCGTPDQYGDSCESCSRTYSPRELVEPYCAQCGSRPEWRSSEHLFFLLSRFQPRLERWVRGGHVQGEVARKLEEWFESGLQDWDITRDAPYFGFEIPGHPGKYFYVWLDAPIGYMAATRAWAERTGGDFDAYWRSSESTEVVHFIGKDIIYFHALFWPAMLMGAELRTPSYLYVHGFLTVNGQKMSKTRGTFINAETYLEHLDPQYLRYYYAAKLSSRVDDLDLSFEDFQRRIDGDLVHKIANIPSRALSILHKSCGGRLGRLDGPGRALVEGLRGQRDEVAAKYLRREFAQVTRQLCDMAAEINGYFQQEEPWKVAKQDPESAASICTAAVNGFRVVATLLQPILPRFGELFAEMMGLEELSWEGVLEDLEDRPVGRYQRLIDRVAPEKIEALVESSRESLAEAEEPEPPVISLADLSDLDVRLATVTAAASLDGEYLRLELADGEESCTVVARLGGRYRPEELEGRRLLALLGLEPRRIRGEVSGGMVLAALVDDRPVLVFGAGEPAPEG